MLRRWELCVAEKVRLKGLKIAAARDNLATPKQDEPGIQQTKLGACAWNKAPASNDFPFPNSTGAEPQRIDEAGTTMVKIIVMRKLASEQDSGILSTLLTQPPKRVKLGQPDYLLDIKGQTNRQSSFDGCVTD